jgi:Sel1 repeat-containing protein
MIDPSAKTFLNLAPAQAPGAQRDDELSRAVREAVAGQYEMLGELGRGRLGSIVYLVRDLETTRLVVLRLDRTQGSEEYELTVVDQLDENIPALDSACPFCERRLDGWGRFCPQCGRDVTGVGGDAATAGYTPDQLLAAVRDAAAGAYEVLGEMARARGGGMVYFARDLATGAIVALRLEADRAGGGFALGRTQVLKPLVESMGAQYASPTMVASPASAMPAVAPAPGPAPAAPAPPSMPPAAPRPTPPSSAVPSARTEVGTYQPLTPSAGTPPVVAPARRRRTVVWAAAAIALVVVSVTIAMLGSDSDDLTTQDTTVALPPPLPASVVDTTAPPPPPATSATAVLVIDGDLPAGARVVVDGATVRTRSVSLARGRHTAVVRAAGYETLTERLDLAVDTLRWTPRLARARVVQRDTTPASTQTPPPAVPTCASAATAQDWTNARTLCLRAANAGDLAGQRQAGMMFLRGLGGPPDDAQAVRWLRAAADRDDPDAMFELARIHQTKRAYRDDRRAYELFRRAAARGHLEAELQTGRALEKGTGVNRSLSEAALWYEQAAKAGYPPAQNAYGVFLKKGQGVARDERKALEYLRKAAQGGSADAHFHVGELFEEGRGGLKRSRDSALVWYRKGASLGSEEAKAALKRVR